jgi:bifunctional DNA-binding transcriptional regulator/antitoxin component of YhaV-PrlF toxin-antitoxin module
MKDETVVTSKGTTTIPEALRKNAGIVPGTILSWELREDGIFARRKPGTLNAHQKHIQARAGTWDGKISGVELLKRTRS